MKTILVIFFLSIQSSYSNNTENPATEETFDTVQFYSSNGKSWRIKTYATDQDVHIWALDENVTDFIALARSNTEKHYGDVLSESYIIETEEGLEGVHRELVKRGIDANVEVTDFGAVFWAPKGSHYRTTSNPQK